MYSCPVNGRRILKMPRRLHNSTLHLSSYVPSSESGISKLQVIPGKTYLLRIINAALDTNHFFKIANHNLTVVATDGIYTNPYHSPLVVIAPGQTLDVLLRANQPPGKYYMASLLYRTAKSTENEPNTIPSTGIIDYVNSDNLHSVPKMPNLPDIYDSVTSFNFFNNLTGLVTGKSYTQVPQTIDEFMFITVGLGLLRCQFENPAISCQAPLNQRIASSLNNVSFALPVNKTSILEAFVGKVDGIYTNDFPNQPPIKFDYVNESFRLDEALVFTEVSTKVKQFKYNASVEIVFQTHALVAIESHPMHIHGHNVHVLGQGYGNYDPSKDRKHLNFVNPQMRNTIYVPIGGWVVIRFRADNPGAWYIHCHIEGHVPIGLAGAFLVEDGPTPATSLGPPPPDFPQC
ncbi:hypothetical protein Leryth_021763 [Lithospermum erythrorhizon]|nr:hypothetical protein Leryth_021763 [Lithospermum erythrorhizon]